MNLKEVFKKIPALFTATLPTGGLEISHTGIRFLMLRGNQFTQESVQFGPNVIEEGRIIDEAQFAAALKELHDKLAQSQKIIHATVVIPSPAVYVQAFSVPQLNDKKAFAEAIDLNLQTLSPEEVSQTYYDYQEIKENESAGHLDLLGAFANAELIEAYSRALTAANFHVVSIEFPGLALSRLIRQRWQELELSKHYLIIYVNHEGLLLLILKNGNLYFNHFTSWKTALQNSELETMNFAQVSDFLTQELQKVAHFYLGRTGHQLTEAILIAPKFNYEITELAGKKFSLTLRNLVLSGSITIEPSWFPVLGAALRGLIARSKDDNISLTQTTAKEEYYEQRILTFIGLWRNVLVGTLTLIFLAFLVTDTAFLKSERQLKLTATTSLPAQNTVAIGELRSRAETFNRAVTLIAKGKSQDISWVPILKQLNQIAADVTLERILVDRPSGALTLSGDAPTEQAAIDFKNRLTAAKNITDVSLPLSNLKTEADKTVSFTLTAKVKSFE